MFCVCHTSCVDNSTGHAEHRSHANGDRGPTSLGDVGHETDSPPPPPPPPPSGPPPPFPEVPPPPPPLPPKRRLSRGKRSRSRRPRRRSQDLDTCHVPNRWTTGSLSGRDVGSPTSHHPCDVPASHHQLVLFDWAYIEMPVCMLRQGSRAASIGRGEAARGRGRGGIIGRGGAVSGGGCGGIGGSIVGRRWRWHASSPTSRISFTI